MAWQGIQLCVGYASSLLQHLHAATSWLRSTRPGPGLAVHVSQHVLIAAVLVSADGDDMGGGGAFSGGGGGDDDLYYDDYG